MPGTEERPKSEKHPLWPLYKLITGENWRTFDRLSSSDFKDKNEADFKAFLEEEAKDKVGRQIGCDLNYPEFVMNPESLIKPISNLAARKNYENKWKAFLLRARAEPMSQIEMLEEIDQLYKVWKNLPKDLLPFSAN